MIKISRLSFLFWIFIIVCSFSEDLEANAKAEFAVLYQGRFRSAEAYARVWLYDNLHIQDLKSIHHPSFASSPVSFLWSLHLKGSLPYHDSPIFWISSAANKNDLGLPLKQNRFSYQELMNALKVYPEKKEKIPFLSSFLNSFQELETRESDLEEGFKKRYRILKNQSLLPAQIHQILEKEFPLSLRLKQAGSLFKCLPGGDQKEEWFSLHALKIPIYSSFSNSLERIGNFTSFSDVEFEKIQKAYFAFEELLESPHVDFSLFQEREEELIFSLQKAYATSLAGQIYQEAHGKHLFYPSLTQLKIETLYVSYPWMKGIMILYFLGICLGIIATYFSWKRGKILALGLFFLSFFSHTIFLGARAYILERPPVTNMFETLLYVPWVAVFLSLFFPLFRRQPLALISASLISFFLLLLIEVADLNQHFNQLQAVLDSQFWLMVHVLLVVGSYGIFILGAVLGHIYLCHFFICKKESSLMNHLSPLILQTLYGGTALLLSGTLLGGIWAAQSWGRFWDWDPKESWAFISICIYLLCIHAYRFHYIGSFGLAFGATLGALFISFTWYGVNYLLGTGLHSYGFGEGGVFLYFLFLTIEGIFLSSALLRYRVYLNS